MGNFSINNGGIVTNKEGMPSIDLRYGPYASISAAHAALSADGLCAIGLTVGIINGNKVDEYWYQEGIELSNLVKKIEVDSVPTEGSPNAVSSGGTYNELLNANARIDSVNIQVGALLTKNMLDVRNNWSGAVGGEVEYSEVIPDTITAFDQLYSPVIRIGYGVPMCYSFYSDEEIGDSVIAFYGTDEPENARDYSDMSRPHTILQFTRLDNDTYNDNTQKYRYFVIITSPFDGYLVLEHSKNNDNYTVICPMLEAGRTPTEYSADMTAYINAHLTSTQKTLAQRNIGLEKDAAGGVASLDDARKIPIDQIPEEVSTVATESEIRALFNSVV